LFHSPLGKTELAAEYLTFCRLATPGDDPIRVGCRELSG
jgi:hypothetical protein